ncbi:MAG: pyrimidine-specific ribonucleoside hydrolase RihA, partial [Actinobacteria bacterium]
VRRGDVPVGAGAGGPLRGATVAAEDVHGEDGLGGTELPEPAFRPNARGAVRLMADTLREADEPVTLIPLAPLTNVATFLREHPELEDRISRIVLMGGSMERGNTTPRAEFNIYADPEAAREVFESGLPITMVGLDVTRGARAGPEEVAKMLSLGRMGEIVARLVTGAAADEEPSGLPAPPIHDAVAVASVIEPGILRTRWMRVDVGSDGEARGQTYATSGAPPGGRPTPTSGSVWTGRHSSRFCA